jgi:hypothetical protein
MRQIFAHYCLVAFVRFCSGFVFVLRRDNPTKIPKLKHRFNWLVFHHEDEQPGFLMGQLLSWPLISATKLLAQHGPGTAWSQYVPANVWPSNCSTTHILEEAQCHHLECECPALGIAMQSASGRGI